jgi:8-oxo-dGTP pyrophosphatase MutT (NUDIX family)
MLPAAVKRFLFAKSRKAAGALIFNPRQELLMVRDWVRREWSYPGGYVGRDEEPLAACAREVYEETGLNLAPERYQLLDSHEWERPMGTLTFTTYSATVSDEEAARLKLQRFEVMGSRWVPRDEAMQLIAPHLRGRLRQLWAARDE